MYSPEPWPHRERRTLHFIEPVSPQSSNPPLGREVRLLFATRFVRLFAYGSCRSSSSSTSRPWAQRAADRALVTLTLAGDTVDVALPHHSRRPARPPAVLSPARCSWRPPGLVFALTREFPLLLVAGTIGVISPSGNEVGPFLSIEQAALSQVIPAGPTAVFAWYTLTGSFATALGSLAGGVVAGERAERPDSAPLPRGSSSTGCSAACWPHVRAPLAFA